MEVNEKKIICHLDTILASLSRGKLYETNIEILANIVDNSYKSAISE